MTFGNKLRWLCLAIAMGSAGASATAAQFDTAALNNNPEVRDAFAAFYNMDYATALSGLEQVARQHPDNPLATDYLLDVTLFEELNRLDLLDTTFYANDGFFSGKHKVVSDPAFAQQVQSLGDKALAQAGTLLAKNPNDVDALYAKGWARSLQATYLALAERSFPAALRLAVSAKNDNEDVLRIDPNYIDANLVVGTYEYVVGALPLSFRLLIGIAGITGSKEKGLAMLQLAAQHGMRTSVEARTCMMLFLRREAKYADAEAIADTLAHQYPHDYLFQLETANLVKDSGEGSQAIARYEQVLAQAKQPGYFHNAHLELAYFGLGDTLRGQKNYAQAAEAYHDAAYLPTTSPELKQRCLLAAGKSFDLMHDHTRATESYQEVVNAGAETTQADEARKLIRKPYSG